MQKVSSGAQLSPKAKRKSISYDKYGYLFVAPFFIVFLIFQLYPILFTFYTSVTDAAGWSKILDNKVVGFDSFAKLLDMNSNVAPFFWGALGNTVIMWVCNFVPQLGMALLLASWFTDTRLRLKFQGGFKVMIFMPNIITAATIGMLFMSLFGYPIAPVNTLLQQFGIVNSPIEFFRSTAISRGLISFLQWWMWYGNTMIIMIAGILGINPSLFEASLVDGCSSRQVFWKITLPLIKPILLYNLVTSLVGGLTMFDIPHMMTQGNPNDTTNTVARFIYTQGFETPNNFNVASAASVILFVIIVICSLILNAIMKDRSGRVPKAARRAAK
ncbi:MAG: sugar ABC transporter permease [Clostridiales bacterium]|nr:sugar ABC transporter permease [Clostridiales bacterium]